MPVDDELLEDSAALMESALMQISTDSCLYDDWQDDPDRPKPCTCSACCAQRALRQVKDWRRRCSGGESRLDHNPREKKIVDAFLKDVDDRLLGQILRTSEEGNGWECPSLRDWFVAVSVVRWLATNCGTAVLQAAGWKYTQYDEDWENRHGKKRYPGA